MFDFQTRVFDVPGAQGVIFTVIDDLGTPRVLSLMNLSGFTITCQYQKSTDGGSSWEDVGVAFDLEQYQSGGAELDVRIITDTGRLRLLASGGASAKELTAAVQRASLSSSATFPIVTV